MQRVGRAGGAMDGPADFPPPPPSVVLTTAADLWSDVLPATAAAYDLAICTVCSQAYEGKDGGLCPICEFIKETNGGYTEEQYWSDVEELVMKQTCVMEEWMFEWLLQLIG